jgi:hypothetical protein
MSWVRVCFLQLKLKFRKLKNLVFILAADHEQRRLDSVECSDLDD